MATTAFRLGKCQSPLSSIRYTVSVPSQHLYTNAQSETLDAIQHWGTSYYLPTNYQHAVYLCDHYSKIAFSPQSPRTHK